MEITIIGKTDEGTPIRYFIKDDEYSVTVSFFLGEYDKEIWCTININLWGGGARESKTISRIMGEDATALTSEMDRYIEMVRIPTPEELDENLINERLYQLAIQEDERCYPV